MQDHSNKRIDIPGYEIIQEISSGISGTVYLAERGGKRYALKLILSNLDQSSVEKKFRKEVGVLSRINHPHIVKVFDSGKFPPYLYLTTEMVEGTSLTEMIRNGAIDEASLIKGILGLTGALKVMRRHNVVHRDIKPDNIMVRPSGEFILIDFGFVSDTDSLKAAEESKELLGTLHYAPPEQIGALKRSVDQRSDLYALGVVMYESLTGRHPVQGESLVEIIDSHIKKRPQEVIEHNSSINPVLSKIIAKLLEKEPESRYQSAGDLESDLERLEELTSEYESTGNVNLCTSTGNTSGADKIFGRKTEVALLEEKWSRVQQGGKEVVVIRGESGSGKTRLCDEITTAKEKEAIILRSKCEELKSSPFGFFQNALANFMNSDQADAEAVSSLVQASKGFEPYLVNIAPSLESVLGAATKDKVQAEDEKGLYFKALTSTLGLWAAASGKTIILQIDDIQWADTRSLDVILRLLREEQCKAFFVLGTARSEKEYLESTTEFIQSINSEPGNVIELANLNLDAINEMASSYIGMETSLPEITEILVKLTSGNAYMVKECLKLLVEYGVISYYFGEWVVDRARLGEVPLPKNVSGLMQSRLQNLPSETIDLLQVGSVQGMTFNLKTVASILGRDPEETSVLLSQAVSEDLLFQEGGLVYSFPHDSVREALYYGMEESAIRALHQKIAEFYTKTPEKNREELAYFLAFHFRHGIIEETPTEAFLWNLKAGKAALIAQAHEEAEKCLDTCIEIHDQLGSEIHFEGLYDLYVTMGQLRRQLGDTENAITNFRRALHFAESPLEKGKAHSHLIDTFVAITFFQNRDTLKEAEAELIAGLKSMGIFFPRSSFIHFVFSFFQLLFVVVINALRKGNRRISAEDQTRLRVVAQLYGTGCRVYFCNNSILNQFALGFRNYASVYKLEPCNEVIRATLYLAASIVFFGFKKTADSLVAKAIKAANSLGDRSVIADMIMDVGFVAFFDGKLLKACEYWREAIRENADWLSPDNYAASCDILGSSAQSRGVLSELKEIIQKRERMIEIRNLESLSLDCDDYGSKMIYSLFSGDLSEARRNQVELWRHLEDAKFIAAFQNDNYWSLVLYYIEHPNIDPGWIDPILEKYHSLDHSYLNSNMDANRLYSYIAYARLKQWIRTDFDSRVKKKLNRALFEASVASWEDLSKGILALTRATLARLNGQPEKALKRLAVAQKHADRVENHICLFEIECERARIYKGLGYPQISRNHAELAMSIADKMGWPLKKSQTADEFDIEEVVTLKSSGHASVSSVDFSDAFTKKYQEALLRVSLASTSSLNPQDQSVAALDEINKVMNAEKSFLFLVDEKLNSLSFVTGRDCHGNTILDLDQYSSSVVQKAFETKTSFIVDNLDKDAAFSSKSISVHGLKSIIATPLFLRDKVIGVVYADSTLAKGIFSKDDLELFNGIANHIAIAIATSRMAQVEADKREFKKDLEVSATVQKYFLPDEFSVQSGDWNLHAFYQPASQCSGDWWWHRQGNNNEVCFVVGDVTGHGAGPAMITASLSSCFRVLESEFGGMDIETLLRKSSEFLKKTSGGEFLMTAFGVRIIPSEEKMICINAGAPLGFLLKADGSYQLLGEMGTPLGVPNFSVGVSEHRLEMGDRVFIYTDGIMEATNSSGRQIGMKGLHRILKKLNDLDGDEFCARLGEKLSQETQNSKQEDDFTWVLLDYRRIGKTIQSKTA